MKCILTIISYLSLALIVLAPVLFYTEKITLATNKTLMLIATIVWFVSAFVSTTGWIGHPKTNPSA